MGLLIFLMGARRAPLQHTRFHTLHGMEDLFISHVSIYKAATMRDEYRRMKLKILNKSKMCTNTEKSSVEKTMNKTL